MAIYSKIIWINKIIISYSLTTLLNCGALTSLLESMRKPLCLTKFDICCGVCNTLHWKILVINLSRSFCGKIYLRMGEFIKIRWLNTADSTWKMTGILSLWALHHVRSRWRSIWNLRRLTNMRSLVSTHRRSRHLEVAALVSVKFVLVHFEIFFLKFTRFLKFKCI